MTTAPSCTTCVFAFPCIGDDVEPRTDCRRYPPTVAPEHGELVRIWPQVGEGDWCGEWSDGG